MGGLSYVSSTENKYKYNGKEKQDALGLNSVTTVRRSR
jgi:hypothetical protein